MSGGNFGGGSGTLADPYLIEDSADLRAMAYNLHYKLKNDINISAFNDWVPMFDGTTGFIGTLDGNNKSIIGLQTTKALFGRIGLSSNGGNITVKNLKLRNPHLIGSGNNIASLALTNDGRIAGISVIGLTNTWLTSGSSKIGGLVVNNRGIIDACDVSGTIIASSHTGGIAAEQGYSSNRDYCSIRNSSFSGKIIGNPSSSISYVGGIVGRDDGYSIGIKGCSVKADIELPHASGIGGIVGDLSTLVSPSESRSVAACSFVGSISCLSTNYIGGIVGYGSYSSGNKIEDCYIGSGSSIIGTVNVGGIIGSSSNNFFVVRRCYVLGRIAGTNAVGGIGGNIGSRDFEDVYCGLTRLEYNGLNKSYGDISGRDGHGAYYGSGEALTSSDIEILTLVNSMG